MNGTLEEIMQGYVQPHQRDWTRHLLADEVAYNDSIQASTKATPFFLQRGFYPKIPTELRFLKDTTPAAKPYLLTLREALKTTTKC